MAEGRSEHLSQQSAFNGEVGTKMECCQLWQHRYKEGDDGVDMARLELFCPLLGIRHVGELDELRCLCN